MKVVQIFRKPYDFHFSIEKLFQQLNPFIRDEIELSEFTSSYHSKGLLPRIKAINELKEIEADVYHVTGDVHFLTFGLPKNKTVLTIHDLGFLKHPNLIVRWMLWVFWVYLPVKRSRLITTVSEATKNDILRYAECKAEKIKVVPNFLPQGISFQPKPFNEVRPVILQIGTKFNKNLERTIIALNGINCHLRIIGKLLDSQMNLLKKNNIDFSNTWQLSEVNLMIEYSKCDMVSFCSTLEGFGMVILEAQAIGRPVITSNVSSMPEVAGKGACLVNPFDVDSIRDGFTKVIRDSEFREGLIKKGQINVKRFSLDKVARQYQLIYRMVGSV